MPPEPRLCGRLCEITGIPWGGGGWGALGGGWPLPATVLHPSPSFPEPQSSTRLPHPPNSWQQPWPGQPHSASPTTSQAGRQGAANRSSPGGLGWRARPAPLPGFRRLLPRLLASRPSTAGPVPSTGQRGSSAVPPGTAAQALPQGPPSPPTPLQGHLGPSLPETSTLMMASRGRLLSRARLSLSSPVEPLSRTRLSSFPRSKL